MTRARYHGAAPLSRPGRLGRRWPAAQRRRRLRGPADNAATHQKRVPRRQSRIWRAPKGDARRRRAARGYGVAVPECRGVALAPVAAPGVPSTQASDRARAFRNLRKDAMRLLAVIAFAQQGEEI